MDKETARLPLVALRGLVVYPQIVMNFEVARDISIAAVQQAMEADCRIFLVAQRDMRMESPGEEDLYTVGVIAKIRHILKLPGNTVRILVEGVCRARMTGYDSSGACVMAGVEVCEQEPTSEERAGAYMRLLVDQYNKYGEIAGSVPEEVILALGEIESPEKLVDTVAVNLIKKLETKQELLELMNVEQRYERMLEIVAEEIRIAKIEKEIAVRTRLHIDKLQREQYLREQMHAIQKSLGEAAEDGDELEKFSQAVEQMPVDEATRQKLKKEIARLGRMNTQNPDHNVLRTYLEWVTSLPYGVYTKDNMGLAHARRVLDSEHYGMEKVKDRILEYLSVRRLKSDMQGPILCFAGPPGVGKTSIARSIASALGRKFARMSLGGVRDEAEIRGHRRTYIGAIPGRIISGIKQAGSMNPVFLLDEIDKMGSDYKGDPASAMLEVLDPEINSTFRDHYLDMEFDLSEVMFVTTANDVDAIPRPLYDRMEIIELSSYTAYEKEQIAKKHLIPRQLEKHGLTKKLLRIEPSAVRAMISGYTCESGVRSLERVVAEVCRKGARRYMDTGKSIVVRAGNLEKYLGIPKYTGSKLPKEDTVGVVNGLAWTAYGGTMLPVEAAALEGSGELSLTGNLGDVMKESARTGLSVVRAMAEELGIPADFHKEQDIHIHAPEGAIPKDGPSAGITMALALVSALTGRPVRHDVAMTGEITLTGRVLAIGGLKEKALAAAREGVYTILIPADNAKDIEEIPKEVAEQITFRQVRTFREVVALALAGE